MEKITAVEWLLKILEGQKNKPFDYDEWLIAFNHAKEMEKTQICNAFYDGGYLDMNLNEYYDWKFPKKMIFKASKSISNTITFGKEYEVIEMIGDTIKIIEDSGLVLAINKSYFS